MRRLLLFILIAVLLVAGCGADEATPTPMAPATSTVPAAATDETITQPTEAYPGPDVATATPETTSAAPGDTPTTSPTGAATEAPAGPATSVDLALVAEGLTAPVNLMTAPDESGRLFVVDQVGLIRIISASGQLLEAPFLDLRDRIVALADGFDERGLLGLAFPPGFAASNRFYVYYSAPLRPEAPTGWDHTSHVSAFTVSADNPDKADPASERIILQVDQPQFNHNAGTIAFGPDGYLYIPLGDGGGANDNALGHVEDWYGVNEGGNGQDLGSNLLGSILRIDVSGEGEDGRPYAIPADNPFRDVAGAAEVWAFGFRNPFRLSFDRGGEQQLFAGDAGQDLWEEVNIVIAGGNYGWNVKEGTHCFSTADPGQSPAECPDTDADGRLLIDPIIEYRNGNAGGLGLAVIGGYVYRGSAVPGLDGRYLFGDWSTSFGEGDGTLLVADPAAPGALWTMHELSIANRGGGRLGEFLLSFGQDADGEIYVLTSDAPGPTGTTGRVYRIVAAGSGD